MRWLSLGLGPGRRAHPAEGRQAMSLYEKLLGRAEAGRPVKLGVVGAGQMGLGLVCQLEPLSWFMVTAVADHDIERARAAYRSAGVPDDAVVEVDDVAAAERAHEAER